jgi:hypothetical protein
MGLGLVDGFRAIADQLGDRFKASRAKTPKDEATSASVA